MNFLQKINKKYNGAGLLLGPRFEDSELYTQLAHKWVVKNHILIHTIRVPHHILIVLASNTCFLSCYMKYIEIQFCYPPKSDLLHRHFPRN